MSVNLKQGTAKAKVNNEYVDLPVVQGYSATKAAIGLGNVDNTSDATKKANMTGTIASGNTGFVTGGDVYNAIADIEAGTGFAKTASPTFTGIPKAPTASAGTNTSQLATTKFVQNELKSSTGVVAQGLNGKVSIDQGSSNAKKFLVVGGNGNVTTATLTSNDDAEEDTNAIAVEDEEGNVWYLPSHNSRPGTITITDGNGETWSFSAIITGEGGSAAELPDGGKSGDYLVKNAGLDAGAEWISPATAVEANNTRPVTSAAVYEAIGNINALLAQI